MKKLNVSLFVIFLFFSNVIEAQIASPGDPGVGISVPLDENFLITLLAFACVVISLLKKQKSRNKLNNAE